MPTSYTLSTGRPVAAELGRRLLGIGLADPADWTAARRDPIDFLQRTVGRWCDDAGGSQVGTEFGSHALLTTSLLPLMWDEAPEPSIERMWLVIEHPFYQHIVMRHVVAYLEPIHPRLPVTWYYLFCRALGPAAQIWDWSYAMERQDMSAEWYDEIEADLADGEEFDRPDPASEVIPALNRPPLAASTVRSLARTCDERRRRILEGTLAMLAASEGAPRRSWPDEAEHEVSECDSLTEPCPLFVAVMDVGDWTDRLWDEENEERAHVGIPPLPAVAISFDPRDEADVRRAHAEFTACVRTLGLAVDVYKLLPERDPSLLIEALEEVAP